MPEELTNRRPLVCDGGEALFGKLDIENKSLMVKFVRVHHYEDIEEDAEDTIDWSELWKDEVAGGYTELGLDDWRDDNHSQVLNDACDRFEPSYEVERDYEIYDYFDRFGDTTMYYTAQLELVNEDYFKNITDFKDWFEGMDNEFINYEDIDEKYQFIIEQFFNEDTYEFVP